MTNGVSSHTVCLEKSILCVLSGLLQVQPTSKPGDASVLRERELILYLSVLLSFLFSGRFYVNQERVCLKA